MTGKIFLTFFIFSFLFISASSAIETISFQGEIDFQSKKCDTIFDLKDKGKIAISVSNIFEQKMDVLLKLDHLATPLFDLSSDLIGQIQWVKEDGKKFPYLIGNISSQYSLADYKPIEELKAKFEFKNSRFYIKDFSWGGLSSYGYMDFFSPYNLDFMLGLTTVNLDRFLNFWIKNKDFEAEGTVSGQMKIVGTLKKLFLEAKLESYESAVGKWEYDAMILNLGGIYPQMRIMPSSTVSQKDGASFSLEGVFDLAKQEDFYKQMKELKASALVTHSGSDARWTIKRSKDDSSRRIETNYLLKKGEKKSSLFDRDPDILGIEKTVGF